jgi:hypothetical protein
MDDPSRPSRPALISFPLPPGPPQNRQNRNPHQPNRPRLRHGKTRHGVSLKRGRGEETVPNSIIGPKPAIETARPSANIHPYTMATRRRVCVPTALCCSSRSLTSRIAHPPSAAIRDHEFCTTPHFSITQTVARPLRRNPLHRNWLPLSWQSPHLRRPKRYWCKTP